VTIFRSIRANNCTFVYNEELNSENSLCLARDANQEPPEYKYGVISGFRPEVYENRDLLGSED
jgi:hypothetical protein